MSLNRYAKRRDVTEAPIVAELRAYGLQVKQQDFPDLAVRNPCTGRVLLIEIDGITKHRKRSEKQLKFIQEWQIPRVKTAPEALALFGL